MTRLSLLALVLIGFALRVYRIDKNNFRGDEAFTVQYWMQPTLSETIDNYLTIDPQPLLAYATYNLWGDLVGLSELAVRVLPALFGVLGIPVAYHFARRATSNQPIGLLVALLWTLHPFLIWHSQDARNYALWSTMSLLALWLALRALTLNRPVAWISYVAAAAVAGYLYYLDIFILFALSAYVLLAYWLQWRVYAKWSGAMLTVGVMLAPWYLQPQIRSGGGYGGTTTGFVPQKLFLEFPSTLTFGSTLPPIFSGWLWLVVYTLLIAGLFAAYRYHPKLAFLLGLLGIIPPMLLSLLSLRLNVLAPRYILGVVPAYMLLLAVLIYWLWQHLKPLSIALGVGWVVVSVSGLSNYYLNTDKAPNWTALMAYLEASVSENDLVIQTSTDPAFGYYYHSAFNITADERALPASPDQPAAEIEAALAQVSTEYDSVWLVAQGFTDWASYGIVENWMANNMQLVIDTEAAGLRAEQYMLYDINADEITTDTPLATFGNAAELVDVRVIDPVLPTGELIVRAYWRPLHETEIPLKIFVHLAGEFNPAANSPLWSQDDREPYTWQVGELSRHVYTLPDVAAIPNGDYTLFIGMYDPQTGKRLLTETGADAYTITDLFLP